MAISASQLGVNTMRNVLTIALTQCNYTLYCFKSCFFPIALLPHRVLILAV